MMNVAEYLHLWIFFAFSMVVHGNWRIYIGRNESTRRTCHPVHHDLTPRGTISAEVDLWPMCRRLPGDGGAAPTRTHRVAGRDAGS